MVFPFILLLLEYIRLNEVEDVVVTYMRALVIMEIEIGVVGSKDHRKQNNVSKGDGVVAETQCCLYTVEYE